jgi:hypothetical protein
VIPADVHQLDEVQMSRRHGTRGSSGGELQALFYFGSEAIIKYMSMYKPVFGNDYYRKR